MLIVMITTYIYLIYIICLVFVGFYCTGRAEEPDPVGQAYGDVCLPGHFCPNGTAHSEPCPPGTYQDMAGTNAKDECIQCTPGKRMRHLLHDYSIR